MVEDGDPVGLMVANLCRQVEDKLQVRAANMMRRAAGRRTFAQRLRGWLDSPFGEVRRVNSFKEASE